ncbi:MAG TPA: hypothetical protein VMS22_14860 [Candidatus Eisenbacteria bacterium]|nr:hypothetical protein [Candidatus Eisenbacteria bacterium]
MRRLTTALIFGAAILSTGGYARAATPGAVCRSVCAPRIAEQCAGLAKRALKRCRKPLIGACKQTTPAIACATSAELLRELADRLVVVPDEDEKTSRDITLCATGDFKLRELLPDGSQAPDVAGKWTVRILDGRLVLDLDGDGSTSAQLPVERAESGDLVVDGLPAFISGDGGACAPVVAGEDPAQRLIEIARKLADRTISTVVVDGSRTTKRELTLCSGGTFTETDEIDDAGVPDSFSASGTWTLRADGRDVTIELADASGSPRSVGVGTSRAGEIALDDVETVVRDGRGVCEPAPVAPSPPSLEEQFTAALRDTAFVFTEPSGLPNLPTRVKIGLCGTGRQVVLTTQVRNGSWAVQLDAAGAPVLELSDDAGTVFRTAALSFDAGGNVLLDGQHAPVDEPSLVERACQS